MYDLLIGRQPIYDRSLRLHGYELLHRPAGPDAQDGSRATAEVLVTVFMELGLDPLVGRARAFFNVGEEFLLGALPEQLWGEQVVVELLEDIPATPEVIGAACALKAQGAHLALDDFVYRPGMEPLIELADVVKLDVLAMTWAEIDTEVRRLRSYGVRLLAEKVEDAAVFQECMERGFDLFQGYFLARPQLVHRETVGALHQSLIDLMGLINRPDCETEELEVVISRDPVLTYRLLRLINSAYFGLPRRIDSVRRAIVLLGRDQLRSWVNVLALSNLPGVPPEQLRLVLIRAALCRELAAQGGIPGRDRYFLCGLLSALDMLLRRPLAELLGQLDLEPELPEALLEGRGRMAEALACARALEQGRLGQARFAGLDSAALSSAQLAAWQAADAYLALIRAP